MSVARADVQTHTRNLTIFSRLQYMQNKQTSNMPDLWDNWKILRLHLNIVKRINDCGHPIKDEILAEARRWISEWKIESMMAQTNYSPYVTANDHRNQAKRISQLSHVRGKKIAQIIWGNWKENSIHYPFDCIHLWSSFAFFFHRNITTTCRRIQTCFESTSFFSNSSW